MKIRCDACDKAEASVFCAADEAALCTHCDHHVHHANKLAEKHQRFSLLHPTSKEAPLCDICQDKRALVFCREDRAILCRVCDLSIHKSNEHTQKHNRFLLTGVKLSASSFQYPAKSALSSVGSKGSNTESSVQQVPGNQVQVSQECQFMPQSESEREPVMTYGVVDSNPSDPSSVSTSSISEYLMEAIPGWHVEDFLDFPTAYNNDAFCKSFFPNFDQERSLSSLPLGDLSFCVPQGQVPTPHTQLVPQRQDGITMERKGVDVRRKMNDDSFAVPVISRPSLKKFRYF